MRTEAEVREAERLLRWLLDRADDSQPLTGLEHAHAVLDWILGSNPGNPISDVLADIRAMAGQPRPLPKSSGRVGRPRGSYAATPRKAASAGKTCSSGAANGTGRGGGKRAGAASAAK